MSSKISVFSSKSISMWLFRSLLKILLLSQLHSSTGQELELTAEYLETKLPFLHISQAPYYDGDDKIYLFGGYASSTGTPTNEILSFSISSETIEMVGRLPGSAAWGTVQEDGIGNLYYFGGSYGYDSVYKFNPVDNRSELVFVFPSLMERRTTFKHNESSNIVYILGAGGSSEELVTFDMETMVSSSVANFPFVFYQATSIRVGNSAFIFDDVDEHNRQAFELDLETLQLQRVGPPTLPSFNHAASSVWDGNFIYILGGYPPVDAPSDAIIQFDPSTLQNTFIPVRNLKIDNHSGFYNAPATAYVPSRNRIYCFGGQTLNFSTGGTTVTDEIFYIDLTPLDPATTTTAPITSTTMNPDFFSCHNRPDGMYPHPTDCALFIGCRNEEMEFFSCPPPLLFDPVRKFCDYPDQVECRTSCQDKPDGSYPHPHDCSLFILCRDGSSGVFKCPTPLLFHPDDLTCVYPDEVDCQ